MEGRSPHDESMTDSSKYYDNVLAAMLPRFVASLATSLNQAYTAIRASGCWSVSPSDHLASRLALLRLTPSPQLQNTSASGEKRRLCMSLVNLSPGSCGPLPGLTSRCIGASEVYIIIIIFARCTQLDRIVR